MRRLLWAVLLPCAAISGVLAAQSLATQREALQLIGATAADICTAVPLSQSSSGVQLTGQAKAKLTGALGRIAGIGIQGAAKYQSTQSSGVLQADLARSIARSNDCRKSVFDTLVDRLLPRPASAVDRPVIVHPQWQRANNDWPTSPGEFQDFRRVQAQTINQCGRCLRVVDRATRAIGGIANGAGSVIEVDARTCSRGVRLALSAAKMMQADNAPPAMSSRFSSIDVAPRQVTRIAIEDLSNVQVAPIGCL